MRGGDGGRIAHPMPRALLAPDAVAWHRHGLQIAMRLLHPAPDAMREQFRIAVPDAAGHAAAGRDDALAVAQQVHGQRGWVGNAIRLAVLGMEMQRDGGMFLHGHGRTGQCGLGEGRRRGEDHHIARCQRHFFACKNEAF